MKIVDSHHHLWDIENNYYGWLTDQRGASFIGDYTPICRNYLVEDLLRDAMDVQLAKSVHVEAKYDASDPVGETRWLQAQADHIDGGGFPHAIVAHANFANGDVESVLAEHSSYSNMRGIRHMLNLHSVPRYNYAEADFLADERWLAGFGLLKKYDLSFDLQIYPEQMSQAAALAARYPDIPIILNHAGMPWDRSPEGLDRWRTGMSQLAKQHNVWVKISGLGMVDPKWTVDSIRPFVETTIELFGIDRSMFASNFPVDSLMSSYGAIWRAFAEIVQDLTDDERAALFFENASHFYRI